MWETVFNVNALNSQNNEGTNRYVVYRMGSQNGSDHVKSEPIEKKKNNSKENEIVFFPPTSIFFFLLFIFLNVKYNNWNFSLECIS